jgi:diphosphomevalonate decarboxylase
MFQKASVSSFTAIAHPNIAFIKYWGNRDDALRLPANGSISMNLVELTTQTTVSLDPDLQGDRLVLNGQLEQGAALTRVSAFLELVRHAAGSRSFARVESRNDFPTGAGIASSASAFAALALAASAAYGLELSEKDLSRLARRGSGSACRSVPAGFTEWQAGTSDQDSFATSFAPADHWQLIDVIAVIHSGEKKAGSTEGHHLAATSPIQAARVADAPRRLDDCRQAIFAKNFERLASVIEQDSNLLHAVMMTSDPALYYWRGATMEVINSVRGWREQGIPCAFTIDAGPNVHVICPQDAATRVENHLREIPGVESVLVSGVGGAARLLVD